MTEPTPLSRARVLGAPAGDTSRDDAPGPLPIAATPPATNPVAGPAAAPAAATAPAAAPAPPAAEPAPGSGRPDSPAPADRSRAPGERRAGTARHGGSGGSAGSAGSSGAAAHADLVAGRVPKPVIGAAALLGIALAAVPFLVGAGRHDPAAPTRRPDPVATYEQRVSPPGVVPSGVGEPTP